MAKQTGNIFIEGTIDDLCFYKMDGKYYVRMKSSLSGKTFWRHKAFEGSRKSALQLGIASKIASAYYRSYPKEKKFKGLFNEMTGRVKLWLKENKNEDEVMELLQKYYPVLRERRMTRKVKGQRIAHAKNEHRLFIIPYLQFCRVKNYWNYLKEYSDSS